MRYGVVILGAGASRRMGRPKLTLPWRDSVIVDYLIKEWRELGAAQITIVVSADNHSLIDSLDRIDFCESQRIVNPDPDRGMFSSIHCAAQWSGWETDLTHMVVTLGDQPHLQRSTLTGLIKAGAKMPSHVCQPAVAGRAKHPVLLPWPDFEELQTSSQPTLAHFLQERQQRRHLVEMDDPGLSLDIDTPDDYRQALKLSGQTQARTL
jgi:molybdenum cofactor cytidylyltransferase